MRKHLIWTVLPVLLAFEAQADLSAVVSPGYVFGASERPTTSTLNRLGRPTITITGTVGGTNADLAAGVIVGRHLSDSVVDNVTTALNLSNAIEVATTCAGTGLTGGGGVALSVLIDSNSIAINGDGALSVVTTNQTWLSLTNLTVTNALVGASIVNGTTNTRAGPITVGSGLVLTNGTLSIASGAVGGGYASGLSNIVHDSAITNTHGLGGTPQWVRAVLVCQIANNGYGVNDELSLEDSEDITLTANATVVYVVMGNDLQFKRKDSPGNVFSVSSGSADWKLKVYARYFP